MKKAIFKTYSVILDKALKQASYHSNYSRHNFCRGIALSLNPGNWVLVFSSSSEKLEFLIEINTPSKSNLDYTQSYFRTDWVAVTKISWNKHIFLPMWGKGNPQIYHNVLQRHEQINFVYIYLFSAQWRHLHVFWENEFNWKSKKEMDTLHRCVKIKINNFEQGPPVACSCWSSIIWW